MEGSPAAAVRRRRAACRTAAPAPQRNRRAHRTRAARPRPRARPRAAEQAARHGTMQLPQGGRRPATPRAAMARPRRPPHRSAAQVRPPPQMGFLAPSPRLTPGLAAVARSGEPRTPTRWEFSCSARFCCAAARDGGFNAERENPRAKNRCSSPHGGKVTLVGRVDALTIDAGRNQGSAVDGHLRALQLIGV